jgi:hypothetical protein
VRGGELRRLPALAVWGITLLLVALLLGALPLQQDTPDSPFFVLAVFTLDAIAFASVGALVATRRPGNAMGWVLWAVGLMAGLNMIGQGYGSLVTTAGAWDVPGALVFAWLIQWSFNPVFALGIGFIPLLFPDGRLPSRRWRPVAVIFAMAGILLALPQLLRPGLIPPTPFDNPTGIPGVAPYLDGLASLGTVATFVCVPLALAAAIVRFRRGTATERQQLKWLAAAAGATGIGLLLLTALPLPDGWATGAFVLVIGAFGLIPVAIGIAVLRYRLYEIDRIISRTLGYAILTAILAGVFAGAVLGLQALLRPITQESQVAVAASTLLVAALFGPIRRRVQGLVDRRFDRSRYDAARVADGFGARLRDRLELDAVSAELASTAHAALRPASVSVWVREPEERG